MDNGLWNLQQEARVRVASQREHERRVAEEQNRRTAASLRAARPTPSPPVPPPAIDPAPALPLVPPSPGEDSEQLLLCLLALLLARCGASRTLVVALLYLAC